MKLFSFPRVNQVIAPDTRHTGYSGHDVMSSDDAESAIKQQTDDKPVSNVPSNLSNNIRSGEDRRSGADRRRAERTPSSVAILFDTRTKTIRRKTSRRHEDDEQLQNFSIKI